MFYEELPFLTFDHAQLLKDVQEHVFTLGDQVIQGEEYETPQYKGFGGWSLLSYDGDWRNGFEFYQGADKEATKQLFPANQDNSKTLKFLKVAHSLEYDKPTQAYVGEIKNVLEQIEQAGLTPRRARVTCLKAGCKSLVHSDGEPTEYIARIHIPLITNPKAVFICEGQNLHMEAGKAYMVWVNTWHQIRNDSDQDRYHIIMDAYDTKGVTKGFKYNGDIEKLKEFAKEQRSKIEAAVISPEEMERFEAIRQTFVTRK